MADAFLEKEHKPLGSFPYISLDNKNLTFLAHYHEEIEIVFVESGKIRACLKTKSLDLKAGDICIFMPGEIHSYISASENNLYVYKLLANSYTENIEFNKICLEENVISEGDENYTEFLNIIKEIGKEFAQKSYGYEFAIRSLKNQIISSIIRKLKYTDRPEDKNLSVLNTVNDYLEKNYTKEIDLDEIAAVCHLSKYYFAHLFKELTGISFIGYLSAYRLEKAVLLLRESKASVTDIAMNCGFGNVRSFNRIFKRQFNTTPLKFRKT